MNRDQPGVEEIVVTVREFLEEITERLQGIDRYHAMCASYLLAIAQRELAQGAAADDADSVALAGLPQEAGELAARLRRGEFDDQWNELLPRMLAHVVNKVRISKPEHLEPMHQQRP